MRLVHNSNEFRYLDKEEELMVKPEFEGLWDKKFKKYDADDLYNKKQKFPTCFKTKMEQVSEQSIGIQAFRLRSVHSIFISIRVFTYKRWRN